MNSRQDKSYRNSVGGLWQKVGKLQFDFLIDQGLQPEHFLLDVGCGPLRGGIHFIRYLDTEHYFGIDKSDKLLEAAQIELKENDLHDKRPHLSQMEDFRFEALNQSFEFAIAQSVFTHLPLNQIIRCVLNIEQVLNPEGKFFASFYEVPSGKFELEPIAHPRTDGPDSFSFLDKDPFHYSFETFRWICENSSLNVSYIGDWNHPRDQKCMVFTKS